MIGFSTTVNDQLIALAAQGDVVEQAGGEQVLERLIELGRVEGIAGPTTM